MKIVFGIFFILHGLVHLLYAGQSQRFFELQQGMIWPDGSWAFSKLMGNETTRLAATIGLAVVAVGFLAGGLGVFVQQGWWRGAVIGASALSAVLYILFWNGKMQALDNQGGIGLLLDLAILAVVLVIRWSP
jgi:hypothetical protein